MEHFIQNYRDFKIVFSEVRDEFCATKEDNIISSKSLNELKKKIDKFYSLNIKKENLYLYTFSKYNLGKYSDCVLSKITSINTETGKIYYTQETKKGKQKYQEYISFAHFYKNNETNKQLIIQRKELIKKIEVLDEQIRDIELRLEKEDITQG